MEVFASLSNSEFRFVSHTAMSAHFALIIIFCYDELPGSCDATVQTSYGYEPNIYFRGKIVEVNVNIFYSRKLSFVRAR